MEEKETAPTTEFFVFQGKSLELDLQVYCGNDSYVYQIELGDL